MSENIEITVILCTHNRSRQLQTAMESVAASIMQDGARWEVLVVDNNSSDDTQTTVAAFSEHQPHRFRYIFEPQAGKSHALNTGIREARGSILAFVDDDVTVEPMWLQNLCSGLKEDCWAGAGGKIIPTWPIPKPIWLATNDWYSAGPLVQFDLGAAPKELREAPFGTNMAFRKGIFEKHGGFRTDLGPRPNSEIRGEDSEFCARLLSAGERLRYEPAAIVYHPVPQNRMSKRFFLDWWFQKGKVNSIQFGARPGTKYRIGGVPLYLFRNLAVWSLKWWFAFRPATRFSNKLKVWSKLGEIVETRHRAVRAGDEVTPRAAS